MPKTVQELCRFFYDVTAVTAESYGCVWHLQQRYAGHDVLEVSLEWTYGAITFLTGHTNRKSEHVIGCAMSHSNEQGYNSLTGRSAIADIQTLVRRGPKTVPCHPPTPP